MRQPSLLLGVMLASATGWGHALSEATARLTHREGQFDLVLEGDLFLLVPAAPTAVATATGEALGEAAEGFRRALESGTHLEVDGVEVPLQARDLPGNDELRAVAALLSASGREHGERIRVRLETRAPVPGAARVAVSFPPALGPVVTSFVEPVSAYVLPGAGATFPVRAAAEASGPRPGTGEGLGAEALGLGVVGTAALAWLFRRKGDGDA
jgi:hypothetical protein